MPSWPIVYIQISYVLLIRYFGAQSGNIQSIYHQLFTWKYDRQEAKFVEIFGYSTNCEVGAIYNVPINLMLTQIWRKIFLSFRVTVKSCRGRGIEIVSKLYKEHWIYIAFV